MGKNKMQAGRNVEDRSDKDCRCGCHSSHDRKSNTHHHGTRARLLRRKARRQLAVADLHGLQQAQPATPEQSAQQV